MKIKFDNIACFKTSEIEINKNKINIKYGHNGIGKSSMIKALRYFVNKDQGLLNSIMSFKYPNTNPSFSFDEPVENTFKSVFVYNAQYFNHLFEKRDVLNNTYELVIKDETYEKIVNDIREVINDLAALARNSKIDELFVLLNKLNSKDWMEKSKNGEYKKTTLFYSFATKGPQLIDSSLLKLKQYEYFVSSDFRREWFDWIYAAKPSWYKDEDVCPFCGRKNDDNTRSIESVICELKSLTNLKDLKANEEERGYVTSIASFLPQNKRDAVLSLNEKTTSIDAKDILVMKAYKDLLMQELSKISFIRSLDAINILRIFDSVSRGSNAIDELKNKITNCVLDAELISVVDGSLDIVDEINKKIKELDDKYDEIRNHIVALKNDLASKITKKQKIINEFLKISGAPYRVSVEMTSDTTSETILKYVNYPTVIDHGLEYLSFGEANSLALLLFSIEANSKNESLIVLDDPVSSFDNNKRYAIYDYLFSSEELLKGKTVLLVTHELQTVITFATSNLIDKTAPSFSYLTLLNDVLIETPFSGKDLISTVAEYDRIAKSAMYSYLSRLVAARRVEETTKGNNTLAYNMLSSLIHGKESPTIHEEADRNFSESQIKSGEEAIRQYLNDPLFSYDFYLGKISDTKNLINTYKSTAFNFEKLNIVRFLVQEKANMKVDYTKLQKDVVWNFLCDSFHVESTHIFSIKEFHSIDIPNYIIDMCDEIISRFEKMI